MRLNPDSFYQENQTHRSHLVRQMKQEFYIYASVWEAKGFKNTHLALKLIHFALTLIHFALTLIHFALKLIQLPIKQTNSN